MEQRRDGESGLALWFDIVWKHKWLVVAFAVLVLTATTVFTRRQTRIYEATTQIVIDLNAPRYMPQSGAEVVSLGTGNSWNTTASAAPPCWQRATGPALRAICLKPCFRARWTRTK